MKAKTLRHIIIGLLLATGIFHLAVALLGAGEGNALGLTIFGFLYVGLSFYVRGDVNDGSKSHSRNAILAALVACTLGFGLGGYRFSQTGEPGAMPLMLAIDVAIIVLGVWWLRKTGAK
ncbi:MAG: hypothetical protein AAFW81_02375 [Pseudomonadota bacterium]